MYKILIRPVLFLFDAETAHHFTFGAIGFFSKLGLNRFFRKAFVLDDPKLEREVFGVKFKNPVGLAAGFDKDAKRYNEFSDFGFGFVEIGTVTPKPQDGNPKKRLFRLLADKAIINRMGFNNKGVFEAVEQLKKKHRVIVGGNIGKNKVTSNEDAIKDYLICFEALFEHVDYFVVNVSSPNTPGLRELQDKAPLTDLLKKLKRQNSKQAKKLVQKEKPILLKIAPDLTDDQLLDIIDIVRITQIDGVIATNTTIERKGLKSHLILSEEQGGLSGKPLGNRSTEVIRFLSENSNKAFPIIGVGGIHSPEDALEKLDAGADLIQLYTGFIYEGPGLVKKINKAILERTT
ncbi:dihydroorotate oxidase A [Flagellimonas taeanensis]|jgi:dihydroorotate dehydrogenase|uniref:Dihydroorotate dehydrogenase (quinone) n=1 Tax=Flagellimonas taeanensis TaxID=1005926 RepID=A0A1M6RWB8_9FLAO|nr:quinone-dependent dihydroorotate dehydrogenase [Allomuricauda taeanensis]MEE1962927.1 quinone-dependent dihydroorotate dehydrogenase [Allomuricauda taeanensis]SFB76870.1 dihydroorotate oxidase A [Allomuricauda taeanensis]SHK36776.1 dihydroorotate oxidase A [Allomuricauda taeanensis]